MNSMRAALFRKDKKKKITIRKLIAKEKFYEKNFYIFEIGFIIIAIPVLVLALLSIPVLIYFTLAKNFHLWPFILLGVLIAFFQILALQYFVKRFYLDPYEMTFGEYLRFRFEDRRRNQDDLEGKTPKTWYDNLDDFILRIRAEQREQTCRMYTMGYENVQLSP